MTKKRLVFEWDGITYYLPKAAADNWKISHQAVTTACKEGRIVGAKRDSSNRWCIPSTAMMPLEKDAIRKVLILTLGLKNNPNSSLNCFEEVDVLKLYQYLRDTGYINAFNEKSDRIPYEAIVTNKGMNLVIKCIDDKKKNIDWVDLAITLVSCLPPALKIAAAVI